MYQMSAVPQFYAPPPLIPQEFARVFNPPPPYQEDLPENHTYKSGTRISPPRKLLLQIPDRYQQTPNLDSTYEHAYCHNLILLRPGQCLEKSADSEISPVSSKDGKVRTKSLWRNLVRKVRRRRQSAGFNNLHSQSKNLGFRQRCRSLSSGESSHAVQTITATQLNLMNSAESKSTPNVISGVKPPTPPPRGIVKPPRQLKNLSPDSSISPDFSGISPSSKESSLNKIKKSVSFSNIRTSSLIPVRDNEKGVVIESYVVDGYVFTKL